MVALALSCSLGLIVGLLLYPLIGVTWAIVLGVLAFIVCQVVTALVVRRKIIVVSNSIQEVMSEGQQNVNRRLRHFQNKPQGGARTMQLALEKEMGVSLRKALELTDALEVYRKWNLLMGKQIATIRLQLLYQLKEFDKVDALMPAAMFLDPMTMAMKLARQYKNDDPAIDKTFQKAIKKFRGEKGTIIYGVYSYAMVKKGEFDKAIKALVKGKDETEDETLQRNWENLVNGKEKRFSNAGLGEQWYGLYLEEPKMKQKQKRVAPRGNRRF